VENIKHEPKFLILFSGQRSRKNQNIQQENAGNLVNHKIVADPKSLPIFDMKTIVATHPKKLGIARRILHVFY